MSQVKAFEPLVEPSSRSQEDHVPQSFAQRDSERNLLQLDDSSLPVDSSEHVAVLSGKGEGATMMDEGEMDRHLMDVESSFLPEQSLMANGQGDKGTDDTFIFGGTEGKEGNQEETANPAMPVQQWNSAESAAGDKRLKKLAKSPDSPPTPADAYKTPAPIPTGPSGDSDKNGPQDSSELLISMSSPAAAAASRNVSKSSQPLQQSAARQNGIEGAVGGSQKMQRTASGGRAQSQTQRVSSHPRRHASQRSLGSAFTEGDAPTEDTVGADYALSTGGAIPSGGGATGRVSNGLLRLPSFGSIASSIDEKSDSGLVTGQKIGHKLSTLDEERIGSPHSAPATPTANEFHASASHGPTDTVIAQHVQNIHVPDTIVKEFHEKHRHHRIPEKRASSSSLAQQFRAHGSAARSHLSLKEQNSKIDKLSKENFDLKLKIHFLDQALQIRSDEGIKEMIDKNVQYQTDLANEKKENASLRKKIKELEKRLREQEEGLAEAKKKSDFDDDDRMPSSQQASMEEEIIYLKEQLDFSESQVEKMREENLAIEAEKRRLTDHVKSISEATSNDVQDEAAGMWRELLEAETARREEGDQENARLREELSVLRNSANPTQSTANSHVKNYYSSRYQKLFHNNFEAHHSELTNGQRGSADPHTQDGASSASITLVEQLRTAQHENSELRKDLHAQTSMLTSRNRERERLQQEIEDLKLAARRSDGRSAAGDSIFERSASRAVGGGGVHHHANTHRGGVDRSASRASGATRVSQLSDAERDEYEKRTASLRDDLAEQKLLNQELERELNAHIDRLEAAEEELRALREEEQSAAEDMQALQLERDELLGALEDKEIEFGELEREALATVEELESRLVKEGRELVSRREDFAALQMEMKNVSESVVQLENQRLASDRKIQNLEQELEDATRELEIQDKRLTEVKERNERLEITQESHQSEISFLREEQEGDKIRIGELEDQLNAAQATVQDEKDRYREIEERLRDERRQHDIINSKEKKEVQRIIDELNSQNSRARDEIRKLRKSLSAKEVEATNAKTRLDDLETNLREALGGLDNTKHDLLKGVIKLQKDLDSAIAELAESKSSLAEKEHLLRQRDALLESAGLESRRLSELLDKERAARMADRRSFDTAQRQGQVTNRSTLAAHERRVLELETANGIAKRKLAHLEERAKSELHERNNLLLALWHRLSTVCGQEWCASHALIAGGTPSLEIVAKNLPEFSAALISAVKTVEVMGAGWKGDFRHRLRAVEKELWRDFQTLQNTLDTRLKRLDQLEVAVENTVSIGRPVVSRASINTAQHQHSPQRHSLQHHRHASSASSPNPAPASNSTPSSNSAELTKLRGENKILKAELQSAKTMPRSPALTAADTASSSGPISPPRPRHASLDVLRAQSGASIGGSGGASDAALETSAAPKHRSLVLHDTTPIQPSEQQWIQKLRELERRLKAEREGRKLDRSGARKRLEEGKAENDLLKLQLQRERVRRGSVAGSAGPDAAESAALVPELPEGAARAV